MQVGLHARLSFFKGNVVKPLHMKNMSGEGKHRYEFEGRELNSYPFSPSHSPLLLQFCYCLFGFCFPSHFTVSLMVWGNSEAYIYFFILFHLATIKHYSTRAFRSVLLLVFLRNIFVLVISLKSCIILCVSLR